MTTIVAHAETSERASPECGAAGWLACAAAPTFALMAWIATNSPVPAPSCSSGHTMPPMGGMAAMYLLMSLFHLPPWLKLASGVAHHSITEGDRP